MSSTADDLGKLVLRLTLGVLMLLHGVAKVTGGVGGIQGMLQGAGLPPALAWGVYLGEIVGPILVILGFYSRVGAALILVNMIFAVGLAHTGDLLLLTRTGGWALELQAFFFFTALALMLTGPGRMSVNQR